MSTLLIRNVQLDGNVTNILIEGNRFANLTAPADTVADERLCRAFSIRTHTPR